MRCKLWCPKSARKVSELSRNPACSTQVFRQKSESQSGPHSTQKKRKKEGKKEGEAEKILFWIIFQQFKNILNFAFRIMFVRVKSAVNTGSLSSFP